MDNTIRYFSLVLSYKGNRCKRHKWILALLKPRGLIKKTGKKIRAKG